MLNSSQNILVVDDTPDNLRLLIKILSIYGYMVRPALDGELAFMAIEEKLPDLILLDIMLPHTDGYEICQTLKQSPETQDIPIIFISALNEVFDKVRGFSVGGVDYITKPFQEQEVLARVRTHLMLGSLQQELQVKNEALELAKTSLENEVQQRTLELVATNATLKAEIAQREQYQTEKEYLLATVRQQSEQLHGLTNWLMNHYQQERQTVAQIMQNQMTDQLSQMKNDLHRMQGVLREDDETLPHHLHGLAQRLADTEQVMAQLTATLTQPASFENELNQNPHFNLSPREQEVLQLLVSGRANREIAQLLQVATSTIATYRNRIMRKLGVTSTAELVHLAMRHGISKR
ncbi:response regulator [Anaerolineales bacterium HSG24]|nr:response regulator [Anaerolineales bacterium HSG24]